MALIWADGFDHYSREFDEYNTPRTMLRAASYISADYNMFVSNARTGAAAVRVDSTSYSDPVFGRLFQAGDNYCCVGVGVFNQGNGAYYGYIFNLISATGRVSLVMKAGGILELRHTYAGGSTVIFTSPPDATGYGRYDYIEFAALNAGANSTVEVRVNNIVVYAGQVTLGNDKFSSWTISGEYQGGSNNYRIYIDDLYIIDGTGDINNDFLGDIRCRTLYPDANGPNQDWSVTGADTAFDAVNDVPFSATKYIAANTVGQRANFSFDPVPVNTAYCVGIIAMAALSKTDAGPCTVRPYVTSGGVDAVGADLAPGTDPGFYRQIFERNPVSGAAWDYDQINTVQVGFERTA